MNEELKRIFSNIDLSKMPNIGLISRKSENSFNLGACQENYVIDILNKIDHGIKFIRTPEYLNNGIMRSIENSVMGDIVGIKNGNPYIWIDLKVAEYSKSNIEHKNYYGVISLDSIFNFAKDSTNHYYLLSNVDGSNFNVVNAIDVWNLYNNEGKCLLETNFGNRNHEEKYNFVTDDKYVKKNSIGYNGKDYIVSYKLLKYSLNK